MSYPTRIRDEVVDVAPVVGSDETLELFRTRCAKARARQTVDYAVAPGRAVVTLSHGILRAGSEVTLELLAGADVSPVVRLQRLLEREIVLAREGAPTL